MTKEKSILIKNIYYMLSYSFKVLNESTFKSVSKEEFDNIHNLFAAILSKGIGVQLKQGLYREYVNEIQNLAYLRGKINLNETMKQKFMRKQIISCDFDELSVNNLLNQIVKSTVLLLIKHADLDVIYKNELKQRMLFFSEVEIIDLKSVKWSSIKLHRHNQTYQMLLSICKLIVEGMIITTDKGDYKIRSFVSDENLAKLYERFILEYYKKHFPNISVRASQIPWSLDTDSDGMLPVMQSDVTLSYQQNILIIDAKFYGSNLSHFYERDKIISGNLYQIFTYVKNKTKEVDENITVSGMLLYAKTEAEVQPDSIYQMSGNQISVKTLDLNRSFNDIKSQLNKIVEDHFRLAIV